MTFDASLARLASLSDAELALEWWSFRGKRWDGYAMYHALEEEQRAATEAPVERSESARILSLEQALEFIRDDEAVEVTPRSIRLRKVELSSSKRQTMASRLKRERLASPTA